MSSIRFLYKTKYIPDSVVTKGSEHPVMSGAVYDALQNIQANALFETGYFSDGIVGYEAQHIMSFNSGTLKVAKDSVVYYPAGLDKDGEPVFKAHKMAKDATASTGSLDGYKSEFFINTNTDTLICNTARTVSTSGTDIVQKVFAQETDPLSYKDITFDGYIWWDTKENLMKVFEGASNSWKTLPISLPVGIVECNGINISGIAYDFLTCGYVDNYAFINPGVIMLAPCGRSEENQSSYAVEMFDTDKVLIKKMFDDKTNTGFEDYKLYVTTARELIGAVGNISLDRVRGCYVDGNNKEYHCCPVATLSAKRPIEGQAPCIVSAFNSRLPIAFADKDDIENVVKLVGSSHGLTIDELEASLDDIYNTLNKKINDDVTALDNKLSKGYVRNSGDETVAGVKTFSSAIKGNLDGKAARANTTLLTSNIDPEIIPTGIRVNGRAFNTYTDAEKSTLYTQTSVRIGSNKVTAELFEGRATSMRWADLAEIYEADANYEIGTLVMFGGKKEITLANGNVNAVVSDKPALLMNSGAEGLPIAMVGRVKVRVLGACKKFDKLILHESVPGVAMVDNGSSRVIARALEDKEGIGEGLVLCVVQLNLD